jgi:hypothetical protein
MHQMLRCVFASPQPKGSKPRVAGASPQINGYGYLYCMIFSQHKSQSLSLDVMTDEYQN